MDGIVVGDVTLPATFVAFVGWLALAGPLVSAALERLWFWNQIDNPHVKEALSLLPFFVMPLLSRGLAEALKVAAPETLAQLEWTYVFVVGALGQWLLSKATHASRTVIKRYKVIKDMQAEVLAAQLYRLHAGDEAVFGKEDI